VAFPDQVISPDCQFSRVGTHEAFSVSISHVDSLSVVDSLLFSVCMAGTLKIQHPPTNVARNPPDCAAKAATAFFSVTGKAAVFSIISTVTTVLELLI
jgi:hypothetical protein